MKLLTREVLKRLPKLGSQSEKKAEEVKIVVKFFDPTGSWSWYASEGEQRADGDWEFFGLVRGFEVEYGSFCLSELVHAKDGLTGMRALPIERDIHFGFEHTLADAEARSI